MAFLLGGFSDFLLASSGADLFSPVSPSSFFDSAGSAGAGAEVSFFPLDLGFSAFFDTGFSAFAGAGASFSTAFSSVGAGLAASPLPFFETGFPADDLGFSDFLLAGLPFDPPPPPPEDFRGSWPYLLSGFDHPPISPISQGKQSRLGDYAPNSSSSYSSLSSSIPPLTSPPSCALPELGVSCSTRRLCACVPCLHRCTWRHPV